ncbi:MAG: DUF1501 domain-containing protein [Chloroflexota bacterium]
MSSGSKVISRRELLNRSLALSALASAQMVWPSWMPRLAFSKKGPRGDVLVCIFLRGAADGLNIIVPHGEKAYYDARPVLNVPRPDDKGSAADHRALDLDGFFGLNSTMKPLLPIFQSGGIVAVHAAGSPDPTRSHFDAMDFMERGTPGDHKLTTGWIGRHLATLDTGNETPLRAIGWGNTLQQSLRGTINATAIKSIVDYHLAGRQEAADKYLASLNALYSADSAELETFANQTNAVLDLVSKVNVAAYVPANGVKYNDENEFDQALMQTAALIKAEVGLEVSAIDLGGWDTHHFQAPDLQQRLSTLSNGLANFYADMGNQMKNITVVVMSEFGRRVQENASQGTDHGHGNMMLVMSPSLIKKPVVTKWPGLAPEQLFDGDLAVTTDYRDILAEIVANRLNNPSLTDVFPNFTPTPQGIIGSRS